MDLSKWSPMTTLTVVVVVVGLLTGAVVTVVNPDALSFGDYFDDVTKVLAALGLAVPLGRGIHFGLRDHNPAPTPMTLLPAVQSQEHLSSVALQDEDTELGVEEGDLPKPPRGQHV